MGVCVLAFDSQRFLQCRNCLVKFPQSKQHVPANIKPVCRSRPDNEELRNGTLSLNPLSLGKVHPGQLIMGFHWYSRVFQGFKKTFFGLVILFIGKLVNALFIKKVGLAERILPCKKRQAKKCEEESHTKMQTKGYVKSN